MVMVQLWRRSSDLRNKRNAQTAPTTGGTRCAALFHQQHRAAALDLARDFAVHVCRHAGHATRKDFAAFADESFQEIGVLVIDCFDGDIDPASRHGAIGATECGTAFWRFWLHRWLLGLAVQSVSSQKWIVFLFLEPIRRARTFFVPRGHVARRRFA